MKTVSPLPSAISTSAPLPPAQIPNRSISAAANGEIRPYSSRLIDTADEIVACDQPNSSCSGSISTPGTDRKPAAPISVTNADGRDRPGPVEPGERLRVGRGFVRSTGVGTSIASPLESASRPTPVARMPPCARIRP